MGKVVGEVTCPMCEKTAEARQEARGSKCYYIGCDCCGILQPRRFGGQVWMRKHVRLFEDKPSGENPKKEPEKNPIAPPEKEKSGGLMSMLFGDDDDE